MGFMRGRGLWTVVAVVALLATGLARPAVAAPPEGVQIGQTGSCLVREGGTQGYRINYQFEWFYADTASLGPNLTIGGTYAIEIHNPTTDQFETLASYPYGFSFILGHRETRAERISPRRPHWVFDQVRLVTTWQIEETGGSGTESTIIPCEIEPAPEGAEVITAPAESTPEPAPSETFVWTADPSPYSGLSVDSSLVCEGRPSSKQSVSWGIVATNRGVGSEGVTVGGTARFFVRTPDGQYSLVEERPFALYMRSNETTAVDGYLTTKGQGAARLEVDWQASLGTKVDPGASVQHILRTTACA